MNACKYAKVYKLRMIQVCKCASKQVFKYKCMQVCNTWKITQNWDNAIVQVSSMQEYKGWNKQKTP